MEAVHPKKWASPLSPIDVRKSHLRFRQIFRPQKNGFGSDNLSILPERSTASLVCIKLCESVGPEDQDRVVRNVKW